MIKNRGGERELLVLYYFRWIGTSEELQEFVTRAKSICDEKGVKFVGLFAPTSEWNAVAVLEGPSYDKVIEAYGTYVKKYGSHPKQPIAKIEILHTFEELGY